MAEITENIPALWLDRYPWRRPDAHKYVHGHVLVLGGDVITGASRLAAVSALRIGAGLVTLAAPRAAWPIYASALTSVIARPIDTPSDFVKLLCDTRINAVVLGPGAGVGDATRDLTLAVLRERRATVLDADALTSFVAEPQRLFGAIRGVCIMTPHEGEFARLFTQTGDRIADALAAAQLSNAIVVLKGPETIIAAPDGRTTVNPHAQPFLATGGTGDVLAGMIAGLLAQSADSFDAACAAVWLHGDTAAYCGIGLLAEDLPNALPTSLARLSSLRGKTSPISPVP